MEVKVLELAGTPYEIGSQHGEALRGQIREFFATAYEVHAANLPMVAGEEALLRFCRRSQGFFANYAPDLVDELRGIADGAGLTFDQIVYLNSFLEMEDLRAPGLGGRILDGNLWGCSTFNILPAASTDGKSYIGQTFDMEQFYAKFNVLLRIKPSQGPACLVYSLAGLLGLNGFNERGVALVINKIVANDAREGVIYPLVVRKALAQERIGDALGAVIFAPRASGVNYQLASDCGVAFCAETSATYYELLPFDGAIGHTNHYLSPAMRRFETPKWLSHGGSYVRHQVLARRLREGEGAIDAAWLKALTIDHTNYPRCICAHGMPGLGECESFQTIAAVVIDPAARSMWFCHENPCRNEYELVTL